MAKNTRHSPKYDYDCAIIGGGPGGLVAALYLRRFKRSTVVFNSGKPRVAWGPRIRNLIGYDQGIPGHILLRRLTRQISHVGNVDFIKEEATVTREKKGFRVVSAAGSILVRKVILATGITDVHPEVSNLVELRELGLLKYCSICDGFEVRNKPVGVLAADDWGIQKALFIGNWTTDLRIVVPKSLRLAPQRVHEIRKIGASVVKGDLLRLAPARDGNSLRVHVRGKRPFTCSVLYVELGCTVNDAAFRKLRGLRRTKEGFIITTIEQRTSIPGLFAVGDCVNQIGQVSVAAGQAAVAATTIHNDLLEDQS